MIPIIFDISYSAFSVSNFVLLIMIIYFVDALSLFHNLLIKYQVMNLLYFGYGLSLRVYSATINN